MPELSVLFTLAISNGNVSLLSFNERSKIHKEGGLLQWYLLSMHQPTTISEHLKVSGSIFGWSIVFCRLDSFSKYRLLKGLGQIQTGKTGDQPYSDTLLGTECSML